MKIYYFSGSTLPSGAANAVHVMRMCEAWGKAGHEVTLFAKGQGGSAVFNAYGVEECFKIIAAPAIPLPFVSGLVRVLHALFHSLKPADIVYGRDAVLVFLKKGIFEAHQVPGNIFFIRRFAKIVAISEALKGDLEKICPQAKFLVAHDGAVVPETPPAPAKLKGAFKIGYAGSLHKGKGLETITALAEECPDYDFHIFGGTEEQIKQAPQFPNLFFHGHVPHGDLPGYLAACDVLIAPYSQSVHIKTGEDIARWISPLKLFEYAAAGKPVICSDLPVIQEILTHEKNALLIPPENIAEWKGALKRLEEDTALRETLAQNAFENLKENYSWSKRTDKILNFCNKK